MAKTEDCLGRLKKVVNIWFKIDGGLANQSYSCDVGPQG